MHPISIRLFLAFLFVAGCLSVAAGGEPIPVRYAQGSTHAYLALKTLDGKIIATGEATQTVKGDRVTSRLMIRFRDGSVDDELTVFTQRGVFRLISDHQVQRGPSFPKPIDFLLDAVKGEVTIREDDGTVTRKQMEIPADVSNGLPPNLLLNILPSAAETKVSYVAPGAKPRLVHLSIKPVGSMEFAIGGMRRKATDFAIHVEIGGVAGVIAPVIGKEPPDYHIWIIPGTPPAFVREEGPLYEGGPIWRVEQIVPTAAR